MSRTTWQMAVSALLCALLAACSGEPAAPSVPPPAEVGDPSADAPTAVDPPPGDAAVPPPEADAVEAAPAGQDQATPAPAPDPGAEGTQPTGEVVQPASVPVPPLDGPLGSLCRTYLQPAVPRLVIEVDAQQGAELSADVIAHLRDTLAAVVDKPEGVVVQAGGTVPGGAEAWTLDRIRQVAAGTRDVPNADGTVVMHVLSLAGEPQEGSDIGTSIGVAFAAGEFVVFPDRVDSLAALLGGVEAVLRAVTVHEAGHLLCLVNLTYTSEIAHEDPEHPKHSASRGSVMFHAIETTAIGQLFTGPPPTTFDADDLADLEGLRTGRY